MSTQRRVGRVRATYAFTNAHIVAGLGTGPAAQGGYAAGTYLGSFAVGLWDCLIGGTR